MSFDAIEETRRQAAICNSCRYCEGYCAVFPAMHAERWLSDGEVVQLANLCHNCQNCYYACQYVEPHEFALNLPRALADTRRESWEEAAFPAALGRAFHRRGAAIAVFAVAAMAALFAAARALPGDGEGFYAAISHTAMVAIFLPAFLLPVAAMAVGLRRYWRRVGGAPLSLGDLAEASRAAAGMRNLRGGHGDGCNYEDGDGFSHRRRLFHQLVMYGFLLCFASTATGTVLHYGFAMPAPYPLLSLPKLFGISGGIGLCLGCLGLMALKLKSRPELEGEDARAGAFGFILLLFATGASGLALYAFRETAAMEPLLALHLGAVMALFLLWPYSKAAHGAYRFAALARDAQRKRLAGSE